MQHLNQIVSDRGATQSDLEKYLQEIKRSKDVSLPKNYDTVLDILHDEIYDESQQRLRNGGFDFSGDGNLKDKIESKLKGKFYQKILEENGYSSKGGFSGRKGGGAGELPSLAGMDKKADDMEKEISEKDDERYVRGMEKIKELDHQLALKELELRAVRSNLITNRVNNNECMESIDDLRCKLYLTEVKTDRGDLQSARSSTSTLSQSQTQTASKKNLVITDPVNKAFVKKPATRARDRTFNKGQKTSSPTAQVVSKNPSKSTLDAARKTDIDFLERNKDFLGLDEHDKFIASMTPEGYQKYLKFMEEAEIYSENPEQLPLDLENHFQSVFGQTPESQAKFAFIEKIIENEPNSDQQSKGKNATILEMRQNRDTQKKLADIDDKLSALYAKMDSGELETPENIDALVDSDTKRKYMELASKKIEAEMRAFETIEADARQKLLDLQARLNFDDEESQLEAMREMTRENDKILDKIKTELFEVQNSGFRDNNEDANEKERKAKVIEEGKCF